MKQAVFAAFLLLISALSLPAQPERMALMLDQARQTPARLWPQQRDEMVRRLTDPARKASAKDPAFVRASEAVGAILDQARAMSDADFAAQQSQLLAKIRQVVAVADTPPPARTGPAPIITNLKIYQGAMFDAHLHLLLPSDMPSDQIVPTLRAAGISGALVFVPADLALSNLTARLQQQNPGFLYLAAAPPRDRTNGLLVNDEGVQRMEQMLSAGGIRGIGEIPLRHPIIRMQKGMDYPADGPVALKFLALATAHHLPISVHVEHEFSPELDRALAHSPGAIVIWAHGGDASPALLREMLRAHPDLYADLSCRNPFFARQHSLDEQSLTASDGVLKADWKTLLEEFPGRFMFGSDAGAGSDTWPGNTSDPPRHTILKEIVQYYRSVLGQLAPATAEKIGHANAEKLIGGR